MKKKILVFDLETIANPTCINIMPEVVANKTFKDPEKISADIESKKKAQREEMGLDPLTNIICCAGWYSEQGPGQIILTGIESEKQLLEAWWDVAEGFDHFVSFNGRAFDMRCLLLHGMAHGVRPSVSIDSGRYNHPGGNHTDLRPVLAGEGQFAKGKLDFFAKLFLKDHKTEGIDGALVQQYWDAGFTEEIGIYCGKDCEITWNLYQMALIAGLVE
jgi:predicted PolB exonuclease-like 3'-5' exonuclease